MFTGIIAALGTVETCQPIGSGAKFGQQFRIAVTNSFLTDINIGDSIALNGACMTVTSFDKIVGWFEFTASAESLAKIVCMSPGDKVNLEKALSANERFGGHFVSGHIDCQGQVTALTSIGESLKLTISCAKQWQQFFAPKGSVSINGVSLTINEVQDSTAHVSFSINLIPHTLANTTLQYLQPNSWVNIEIDTVARYLARMLDSLAIAKG